MKVTAIANSNIALVKYWGKRDEKYILPNNGSISMTLDKLNTTTTVEFGSDKDVVILNEKELTNSKELEEVASHLNIIRKMAKIKDNAKVVSKNNFPTAAGLASSASGFAALSLAGSKAAGLDLSKKELSILARRGSGSASRSIEGGFVEWLRGQDKEGEDSYGKQIVPKEHWPGFRMVTTIVDTGEKKVKSRVGMAQTVSSCPYYDKWLSTVKQDLDDVKKGILERDFTLVGTTAEHNALKMHATMITTKPSIIYWNAATMNIIHAVQDWRDEGLESYFTIDAGPQVKIMCLEKDTKEIQKRLKEMEGIKEVVVCQAGDGAHILKEHLF
jgi:diphosphomevalonate decarboxylase